MRNIFLLNWAKNKKAIQIVASYIWCKRIYYAFWYSQEDLGEKKKEEVNKNVNFFPFLRFPPTDSVCIASKQFFEFSPNSNRNGLSRIYFYGALVPFLFLLGNQFAKSPFTSLIHPVVAFGSWPALISSLSYIVSHTQEHQEFDLSSLIVAAANCLSLRWFLRRETLTLKFCHFNGIFLFGSCSILFQSTTEKHQCRINVNDNLLSHI